MNEPIKKPSVKLSVYGMLVTAVGGVSYFLLTDIPFIRNTAAPNIVLVVVGMAMAGWGVVRRRSKGTIISAGVSAFVGLGLIGSLTVLMKLPEAEAMARTSDTLPDFTLPNQDGVPVTLSSYKGKGPVLLVFYRGHW